jgi:hypothetical protein
VTTRPTTDRSYRARLLAIWRDWQNAQYLLAQKRQPWRTDVPMHWRRTRHGWRLVGSVLPPRD